MASGNLDGPDNAASGLVHLVSLNFLTLRPLVGFTLSEDLKSVRMRVEILKSAFDACGGSLVDDTRKLWKKSMMSVMAWLRPEVLTSEARYGYVGENSTAQAGEDHKQSGSRKPARFDVGGLYEAIRPSKEEPMLDAHLPGLLPELRPYQRRAAYWMAQREKVAAECSGSGKCQLCNPLCVPLSMIQTASFLYYNPFCGNISLRPEYLSCYVPGGILADERAWGKLLSCLLVFLLIRCHLLRFCFCLMMKCTLLEIKAVI